MRVLSHPARWKLIDHLGSVEAATATECAAVVGLSPSAMSYHLRALAKAGLIEEAEPGEDGRERRWRRKVHGFTVSAGYSAAESEVLAERAMTDAVFGLDFDELRAWMNRRREEPREWYEAANHSRTTTFLTAAETAELSRRISAVVAEFTRGRSQRPEGARQVAITTHVYPAD